MADKKNNQATIIIVLVVVVLLVVGVVWYISQTPSTITPATAPKKTGSGSNIFSVLSGLFKPKNTPTTVSPINTDDDGGYSQVSNMFDDGSDEDDGGAQDIENMFDDGSDEGDDDNGDGG